MYLPCKKPSSKLLIYFHGNAEDMGHSQELLILLRNQLKVNVLALEFPGYGIYQYRGYSASEKSLLEDSHYVLEFLTQILEINTKDILILGRSIGTGPATEMASLFNPSALILISAFTSLSNIIKDQLGAGFSLLVNDRFNNEDLIQNHINCPVFFIHGSKDMLIPSHHSQKLHQICKSPSSMVLPKEMDHNTFDFFEDFCQPLYFFLLQIGVVENEKAAQNEQIKLPDVLYQPPQWIHQNMRNKKSRICCWHNKNESFFQLMLRKILY